MLNPSLKSRFKSLAGLLELKTLATKK